MSFLKLLNSTNLVSDRLLVGTYSTIHDFEKCVSSKCKLLNGCIFNEKQLKGILFNSFTNTSHGTFPYYKTEDGYEISIRRRLDLETGKLKDLIVLDKIPMNLQDLEIYIPMGINVVDPKSMYTFKQPKNSIKIVGGSDLIFLGHLTELFNKVKELDLLGLNKKDLFFKNFGNDMVNLKRIRFPKDCIVSAIKKSFNGCTRLYEVSLEGIHFKNNCAYITESFSDCPNLEIFDFCNTTEGDFLESYDDLLYDADCLTALFNFNPTNENAGGDISCRLKGLCFIDTKSESIIKSLDKGDFNIITGISELWYNGEQVGTRLYIGSKILDCEVIYGGITKEELKEFDGNLITRKEYELKNFAKEVSKEEFDKHYKKAEIYIDKRIDRLKGKKDWV